MRGKRKPPNNASTPPAANFHDMSLSRFICEDTDEGRNSTGTPSRSVTDDDGTDDWDLISRRIESCVRLDLEYYEYPSQNDVKPESPADDADGGIKVFLGGMRFEIMQQHLVRWLLDVACGVKVAERRILIHRKAKNGKSAAPTGCASVFVTTEEELKQLLSMNQRIFCAAKGIYISDSAEKLGELIRSNSIATRPGKGGNKVRGPVHAMVIEVAKSTPSTSCSTTPMGSFGSLPPSSFSERALTFINGSFLEPGRAASPSLAEHPQVKYHRFEGLDLSTFGASAVLTCPVQAFVGGLCFEASHEFVAWMMDLVGVRLHPQNVVLYQDPQTGVKRGCAQVLLDEVDFARASGKSKCLLCDTHGVYVGETPQAIAALQTSRDFTSGHHGPMHAVVIERRKRPLPHPPLHVQMPLLPLPLVCGLPPPPPPLFLASPLPKPSATPLPLPSWKKQQHL